jgi:hypothetical protein
MDQTLGPINKPSDNSAEPAIRGAEAIGEFIFGDRSHRRKVSRNAPRSRFIGSEARSACDRRRTKAGLKVRKIALS